MSTPTSASAQGQGQMKGQAKQGGGSKGGASDEDITEKGELVADKSQIEFLLGRLQVRIAQSIAEYGPDDQLLFAEFDEPQRK